MIIKPQTIIKRGPGQPASITPKVFDAYFAEDWIDNRLTDPRAAYASTPYDGIGAGKINEDNLLAERPNWSLFGTSPSSYLSLSGTELTFDGDTLDDYGISTGDYGTFLTGSNLGANEAAVWRVKVTCTNVAVSSNGYYSIYLYGSGTESELSIRLRSNYSYIAGTYKVLLATNTIGGTTTHWGEAFSGGVYIEVEIRQYNDKTIDSYVNGSLVSSGITSALSPDSWNTARIAKNFQPGVNLVIDSFIAYKADISNLS